MTDFDSMFATDQLPDLYAEFGKDATMTRGAAAPVPVRVIIDRDSEQIGDFHQVVGRVDTVTCQAAQWKPQAGDILQWADSLGSHQKAVEGEPIVRTAGLEFVAVLHG